ncbi:unnamed protein product [Mytilus edulis]|uniref:Uncharacterized protein n=1 Tax=Mytilus edulis TaxID=6550 RepID=A0A8S3QAX2_MYTED|nr:unnamed protein product [Mytilus edulis]
MLQLVAEWQQQNPADNFDFMPAAEIHSDENGVCLENIEEIEQDDSDEVYTSEKSEASSAFFFVIRHNFKGICYKETFVFLCDFHREQSWTRWTTKISNGVSGAKDKVLAMLRSYIKDNATSMETVGRQYNADVPTFLKDRPSTFIRNCMDKMNLASVVDATDVEKLSSTSFKVKVSQEKSLGITKSISDPQIANATPGSGTCYHANTYASHSLEHAEFRDPIFAMVGEGETVINASHPPKHVEFRDPICTVMGEEDIVIRNNTRSGITLNIEGYQINQNSLDDLDSELPDEVNIEDYDILLGALCENNNHWCLMVIYPQSRELFVFESFRREQDTTGPIFTELVFAEHVLTDNDFMFDSSKRAIRASRHIIGQVLVDNSATNGCANKITPTATQGYAPRTQQQQPKALPTRTQEQQPKAMPPRTQQQQPKAMSTRSQQQKLKAMPIRTQQQQLQDMPPRTQQQQPKDMPQSTQQQQPKGYAPKYTTAATQGYAPQ